MSETKQWMGLHNHDRHFYSPGYGDRCGKCWYCSPEAPCYCCLQAEVEALREKVKQHEVVFKVQAEALKSTREQIQRVRELCKDKSREVAMSDPLFGPPSTLAVTDILRALDGDTDA